jgi:hypothetical protein
LRYCCRIGAERSDVTSSMRNRSEQVVGVAAGEPDARERAHHGVEEPTRPAEVVGLGHVVGAQRARMRLLRGLCSSSASPRCSMTGGT